MTVWGSNYDSWKIGIGDKKVVDNESWEVVMGCIRLWIMTVWG